MHTSIFVVFTLLVQEPPSVYLFEWSPFSISLICCFAYLCWGSVSSVISTSQSLSSLKSYFICTRLQKSMGEVTNKVEILWSDIIRKNTSRNLFACSLTPNLYTLCKDPRSLSPHLFILAHQHSLGTGTFPLLVCCEISDYLRTGLSLFKVRNCRKHLLWTPYWAPGTSFLLACTSAFIWHHALGEKVVVILGEPSFPWSDKPSGSAARI